MSDIRLDPASQFVQLATPGEILSLTSEEVSQIWPTFVAAIVECKEKCMADLNQNYRTPSQKREAMHAALLNGKTFVESRADQLNGRSKEGKKAVMRDKILREVYISKLKDMAKSLGMAGYSQFRDKEQDIKLLKGMLLAYLDNEKCNLNVSQAKDFIGCRDELACNVDKETCEAPRNIPKEYPTRVAINDRPVFGSQAAVGSFAQKLNLDPASLPALPGSQVAPRYDEVSLDGIHWRDVLDMKVKEMISFGKKIGVKIPSGSSRIEALAILREMFRDIANALPAENIGYGQKSPRRALVLGDSSGVVNLSLKSAKTLHRIAKDLNIAGEEQLKKIDLIEKIKAQSVRALSPRQYKLRDIESAIEDLPVSDLREIAKAEGVRGYSRYSPRSLRRILLNKDYEVAGIEEKANFVTDSEMNIPSAEDLRTFKVTELRQIADELNVESPSRKKKESLIRSIRAKARKSVSPALQASYGAGKSVRSLSMGRLATLSRAPLSRAPLTTTQTSQGNVVQVVQPTTVAVPAGTVIEKPGENPVTVQKSGELTLPEGTVMVAPSSAAIPYSSRAAGPTRFSPRGDRFSNINYSYVGDSQPSAPPMPEAPFSPSASPMFSAPLGFGPSAPPAPSAPPMPQAVVTPATSNEAAKLDTAVAAVENQLPSQDETTLAKIPDAERNARIGKAKEKAAACAAYL